MTKLAPPPPLALFRDDGPLALALGALGARLPVSPTALAAAAALPLAAAIVAGDVADGVVVAVVAWAVLAGALSSGRPHDRRLGWLTPVVLRGVEYAALLWLAALAGGAGPPAAFALLCVVAFRQYDLVYRLRQRGDTPPGWTRLVSGGWDGRLVVGGVAWLAGGLPVVFAVAAAVLAVALVGESALGWARADDRPADPDAGEDPDA